MTAEPEIDPPQNPKDGVVLMLISISEIATIKPTKRELIPDTPQLTTIKPANKQLRPSITVYRAKDKKSPSYLRCNVCSVYMVNDYKVCRWHVKHYHPEIAKAPLRFACNNCGYNIPYCLKSMNFLPPRRFEPPEVPKGKNSSDGMQLIEIDLPAKGDQKSARADTKS